MCIGVIFFQKKVRGLRAPQISKIYLSAKHMTYTKTMCMGNHYTSDHQTVSLFCAWYDQPVAQVWDCKIPKMTELTLLNFFSQVVTFHLFMLVDKMQVLAITHPLIYVENFTKECINYIRWLTYQGIGNHEPQVGLQGYTMDNEYACSSTSMVLQ